MGSQCKRALVSGSMADQPEIWKATPMADLFDKIQKLPDKTVGVPNFRRVPGYKVYCCGQPAVEGFTNVLNKVCGETYPKDGKIVWINMRQEPIVYVNGNPICARPPNKIGEYAELGNVTRDGIKVDEAEFVKVIEGKVKANDGKLKFVDVNKKESEVEAKEIVSLHDVIEKVKEKFPGLSHNRIPSATPRPPSRLTSTPSALPSKEPSSPPPSSSPTKSVSPAPPPDASPPASSGSSRSPPASKASLRPFPESTPASSRWTGTPWTPPRILSSRENLMSLKNWSPN